MTDVSKSPLVLAGGGALVGLVVGLLLSNAITDRKIADGIRSAMAEVEESQAQLHAETSAALTEKIAALEAALSESGSGIEDLAGALGERIDAGTSALGERLAASVSEMRAEIRDTAKGHAVAMALFSSSQSAAPEEANAGGAADAPGERGKTERASGHRVGETAVFAGGDVRAFVSRLDAGDRRVRLSVNGRDMSMSAGQARVLRHQGGTCIIGVQSVTRNGAIITSDCDDPLSGQALSAGETVTLADGALRVFFSGVMDGDARLAINGLDTQRVGVGQAVTVDAGDKTCTIAVQGVRGARIGLNASCDK